MNFGGVGASHRSDVGGASESGDTAPGPGQGGYDIEYASGPCFWGPAPSSLVLELPRAFPDLRIRNVLDVGCGEGKNAIYFARQGALVEAFDVSAKAIANARDAPDADLVTFAVADAMSASFACAHYDLVIAYGLFHCLGGIPNVWALVEKLKAATRPGGVHVVCALNSRRDGFADGHPHFRPCLCSHDDYLAPYADWQLSSVSDRDLPEAHAPTFQPHTHAATRFFAKRPHY